MEGKLKKSFF